MLRFLWCGLGVYYGEFLLFGCMVFLVGLLFVVWVWFGLRVGLDFCNVAGGGSGFWLLWFG